MVRADRGWMRIRGANSRTGALGAVTVFEGARVIVGDGRAPIENASFVVNGARFVQVGRAADVRVPAGATRVNLAGKTVMPAIIDTHTHLSQTREVLTRRSAAAGVLRRRRRDEPRSGHDRRGVPGSRADDARAGEVLHRRTRHHGAGTGAHDRAVLGHDDCGSAQGGAGERRQEGRHHQDLGRRPDGHGARSSRPSSTRRSSTKRTRTGSASSRTSTRSRMPRATLRAGLDAFAHGVRDKDLDDEFMALVKQHPNLVLGPNMPDRGVVADIDWLRPSLRRRGVRSAAEGQHQSARTRRRSGASRRATWRR